MRTYKIECPSSQVEVMTHDEAKSSCVLLDYELEVALTLKNQGDSIEMPCDGCKVTLM